MGDGAVLVYRWITVGALGLMFLAMGYGLIRRWVDLRRVEHQFSLAARAIAGFAFGLNTIVALQRNAGAPAGEAPALTALRVSSVTVASVLMLLASLPLQRYFDRRGNRGLPD